jgi:predicted nucleic acid-binding protein
LVRGEDRDLFADLLRHIRSDPRTTVVPVSSELLQHGIDLFTRRPDKTWSLTDCISFVAMSQRGLTDALTADHHFLQAGFRALLLEPPAAD